MKKPSKVGLSKLMDARRKLSTFRRGGFSTKREKSASQQAIKKLLESNFTKAGFELNKFGALIKQSDAEARQKLANLKAESDKQSPAVLETLHGTAENLIANVAHLQAIPATVASPTYFLLDTATEISSNGGVTPLFPNTSDRVQSSTRHNFISTGTLRMQGLVPQVPGR